MPEKTKMNPRKKEADEEAVQNYLKPREAKEKHRECDMDIDKNNLAFAAMDIMIKEEPSGHS